MPDRPHKRFPRTDWIVFGLVLVLAALFGLTTVNEIYINFVAKETRIFVDFTMYHAAARTVDIGGNLYLFHEASGDLPYPYPPLLASLLYPFGKLTLTAAYLLWCAVLFACLGVTTWMSARLLRDLDAERPLLLATGALLLSMFLLDSNLYWGQVNIVVTLITLAGVWALVRERSATAGALIGLAAAMKVLPAALLLWFLVRRDWRAVGAFFGTALVGVLVIPGIIGGFGWAWKMNMEWLKLFFGALTKGGEALQSGGGYIVHSKNGSLAAIIDRFFGGSGVKRAMLVKLDADTVRAISTLARLSVVLVSMGALVPLYRRRLAAVEPWLWPLAAGMLTICGWLINLLLWDHHTIGQLFILPVVGAACLAPNLPARFRLPLMIGLTGGIMGLASGFAPGSRRFGMQTLCLFILWAGMVWALITAPPPSPAAPPKQIDLPFVP